MGYEKNFSYNNVAEIYDEYCQITKGTNVDISGLDYETLKTKGTIQWPCPEKGHPGTQRLFEDKKFYTPSQKAKIHTVSDANLSEKVTEDLPLILTTGRIRDHWHTMTKTGKVRKLNQHIKNPFLEIHELDAAVRGINNDDVVEIFNSRGAVQVVAKITNDIKQGVVFLPMHWGKILNKDFARTNNITNNLVDPKSKEPDFKFSAVEVKKYKKKKEKILVVGAGAGSFRFVTRYRELNPDDEITVFSKEKHSFYNRVMLPEYVSGKQEWEKLVKADDKAVFDLSIKLLKNTEVISLDTAKKIAVDSHGDIHSYDKIILATGSRPNLPKDIPVVDGIFTMRYKGDADKLKAHAAPGSKAVIVGGGLLGLELADSLIHLGIDVTVVQRSSRLMDRQLDVTASDLLHQEMTDRDIRIFYNDEVLNVFGKDKVSGIRLRSGRRLDCDIIIVAIGTIPNIEVGKAAGLKTNRGIVVNDHLQTSNPDVYAIGEIAEYNQNLYGITAAAEEQAETVAAYINGNPLSFYQGSLSMNILKVHGLHLCSLGMIEAPEGDSDYEEVVYLDKSNKYYKKCIIYQDVLVGAILVGDKSEFNEFRELIKNKLELSDKRSSLILKGGGATKEVIGKLVCSCNNVGEGNLKKAIQDGCKDVASLCQTTGAGTGCGSCRPEVKAILEKLTQKVLV